MKEPLNGMAQPHPKVQHRGHLYLISFLLAPICLNPFVHTSSVIKLDFVIMDSIPHAYDAGDKGPSIIAGNITVVVLATVAVVLRIISRRMQRLPLQADDFLIFIALVSLGPWADTG